MPVRRRLAFLVIAGLGLSACQPLSERLADADRQAIQAAVDGFTKAVLANDPTTGASYYAEDGMMLPPNGPVVQGRSAISAFLDGFPPVTEFSQTIVELEANGDLAYARLTYSMTTTPPGAKVPLKTSGKVLIILRKQVNGSWLTTRGMWNSDITGTTVISS